MASALVVVDVQKGLEEPRLGPRDNPDCEANIGRLIAAWRERGDPVVFVRHDSTEPESPLRPELPGNELKDVVSGEPDLMVVKSVNSAFLGEPDLASWLREHGHDEVVICGIQTNMCCESTARSAADLGFGVRFAIDATHTFDMTAPDGTALAAAELARVTAANVAGEFGRVVSTAELVG